MMRMIYLLSLVFTAASLPQIAAAQSAKLDPGLYDIIADVTFAGQPFGGHETEICIRDDETNKTMEELLTDYSKDVVCPVNDAVWTASTVRAEYQCPPDRTGIAIDGTIEAEYGADFFNHTITGVLGPEMKMVAITKMNRKGDCPEGWVDPDPSGSK